MFQKLILFLLWLFLIYSVFYTLVIIYKRFQVNKYLGKEFKTIPLSSKKLTKFKILSFVVWSSLAIAAIFTHNVETNIPTYLIVLLSVLMLISIFIGRGGFDNRNAQSKTLFFNENGILFTPANKNNVFSVRYSKYANISSINFKQNEIYPAFWDGIIKFSNGDTIEIMIHTDDKIIYEAVLGKYIKT